MLKKHILKNVHSAFHLNSGIIEENTLLQQIQFVSFDNFNVMLDFIGKSCNVKQSNFIAERVNRDRKLQLKLILVEETLSEENTTQLTIYKKQCQFSQNTRFCYLTNIVQNRK